MKTRIRLLQNTAVITLIGLAMLLSIFGLVLTTDALANHIKSPGTWTAACGTPGGLACLPEGREGAVTVGVDNHIIVTHGYRGFDSNDTRIYDIALWFLISAGNMWVGVAQAGYSVKEELPIFLLIFSLPVAVAPFVKWKFL